LGGNFVPGANFLRSVEEQGSGEIIGGVHFANPIGRRRMSIVGELRNSSVRDSPLRSRGRFSSLPDGFDRIRSRSAGAIVLPAMDRYAPDIWPSCLVNGAGAGTRSPTASPCRLWLLTSPRIRANTLTNSITPASPSPHRAKQSVADPRFSVNNALQHSGLPEIPSSASWIPTCSV
jgi:hypothetical protein